ncbi:hypothetical protein V6N13_012632 [Hibiscus sabdariffa]|uniref:NAC domain-containing protein n=1 Tax=Hibiscus sabdariffa TaxID=183260 RepID=A0ABR2SGC5_9ROSI
MDKKCGKSSRTNRTTNRGYWKTTEKNRAIRFRDRVVCMKKTLVYHKGRAHRGEQTNWVMHEYRLTDEALEKDIQHIKLIIFVAVFWRFDACLVINIGLLGLEGCFYFV